MRYKMGITVGLAVASAACGSGISVNSDWDPAVDFSQFQTFVVLEPTESDVGQLNENRIDNAIAFVLSGKGLRQVDDTSEADLAVAWQVTTSERSSFQTVSTGWGGYGYGWGGWYGPGVGVSSSRTTEVRYEVGTLAIALFDANRREMIYTATGSKTLEDRDMTPDEIQERIDNAVDRILRDFPPEGN